MAETSQTMLRLTKRAARKCSDLHFSAPVAHIYNPLEYAFANYKQYIEEFCASKKRVVFLGMNPGPFGMTQTGIPFGEIPAVRDWMRLSGKIRVPQSQHPARPIQGYDCTRSEVSGRRLWGLFKERFGEARSFFKEHIVLNYCPLVFMKESGENLTPDKIKKNERDSLFEVCDRLLLDSLEALEPEYTIGVGKFAETRLRKIVSKSSQAPHIGFVLHPSPASPAANRGWADQAQAQLLQMGVW